LSTWERFSFARFTPPSSALPILPVLFTANVYRISMSDPVKLAIGLSEILDMNSPNSMAVSLGEIAFNTLKKASKFSSYCLTTSQMLL
jgi:hypothetical protein